MKIVFLTHSIVSDWNHGNAHFQRGVMRELLARGHEAVGLEPAGGWSRANLLAEQGEEALARFHRDFPELIALAYGSTEQVEDEVADADAVVVHEWTDPALVAYLGRMRARGAPWTLLFHDTHHRAVSAPEEMAALDLDGYDGVLAFGEVLAETYRRNGWGRSVHVWHEAADTRLFRPMPEVERTGDLVWIGNWGDGERAAELTEFLIEPVRRLGLTATVHGVRYPPEARQALEQAGIRHAGWLGNSRVPETFAAHRATVHVPRRFYATQLPGIPTIRPFEALACGIPLVSAPWDDAEGLFRPGADYLMAKDGEAMTEHLRRLMNDPAFATELATHGRETVLARHSCTHRVDELLALLGRLAPARFNASTEAAE